MQDYRHGVESGCEVVARPVAGAESTTVVESKAESSSAGQSRSEEARVFADLSYRQLMEKYFFYLYRKSGGRVPQLARYADISKATAYSWARRFGKWTRGADRDGS